MITGENLWFFHQFKDVLAGNPAERERWFSFKGSRLRGRVLERLEEEGIEPISADTGKSG